MSAPTEKESATRLATTSSSPLSALIAPRPSWHPAITDANTSTLTPSALAMSRVSGDGLKDTDARTACGTLHNIEARADWQTTNRGATDRRPRRTVRL